MEMMPFCWQIRIWIINHIIISLGLMSHGQRVLFRTWLNETFLNNAFSKDEQNAIKKTLVVNENNLEYGTNGGVDTTDKVYLLSIAEASNSAYGFDSEFCEDSETRVAMNSIGEAGFCCFDHQAGIVLVWH